MKDEFAGGRVCTTRGRLWVKTAPCILTSAQNGQRTAAGDTQEALARYLENKKSIFKHTLAHVQHPEAILSAPWRQAGVIRALFFQKKTIHFESNNPIRGLCEHLNQKKWLWRSHVGRDSQAELRPVFLGHLKRKWNYLLGSFGAVSVTSQQLPEGISGVWGSANWHREAGSRRKFEQKPTSFLPHWAAKPWLNEP